MKPFFVFLPGLGADSRLFLQQQKAFKNSISPPWITPERRESLASYSRRWAGHLRLTPECFLVGVSFGGMVAQEMARWIKPKAVVLIGSCRSADSVPRPLRIAGSLPVWTQLSKRLCMLFPQVSGRFLGAETSAQSDLLIRMFLETPDDFAQWTVNAIKAWKGCKTNGVKIHHIHGKKDHLIPLRGVKPDRVISGGGHLINLTHPQEVNGFIRECIGR